MRTDFDSAMAEMRDATVGTGLASPFLALFPIDGVSVATVGDTLGSETLTATDDIAARLDELQFDLGEGPCWDAMHTDIPTLADDIPARAAETWPVFGPAVIQLGVGAMFVFPVRVGPLQLGAIDLYCTHPQTLDRAHVSQAGELARAVSRIVLKDALVRQGLDEEYQEPVGVHSRRVVHQATGRILVQAGIGADVAYLLIQGFAFSTGNRVIDVANDINQGRLKFATTSSGIEEQKYE